MNTTDELWARFVAHGVTPAEVRGLGLETATRQIHELRAADPDNLDLSDRQIAERILAHAAAG